ncbi:hypothetical protein LshimejAT787_1402900 [Lyophyllum shimeji]|uniref:DUF6534 domain-containing protein n=1 Tax=Lyophyllum shimeji TaxID=47721 RepID=A0A9P3USM9_LYOSH|nr:hypothetical protein LshimejAT787_1402900 [Lyophyllum shimeji]
MADIPISSTYGALLLGGSVAFALSGIVGLQCVIYFKLYPDDLAKVKAMVCAVWTLDLTHSAFIIASLINYFVTYFGERERIDYIPWSIAFSVVVTAIQTFIAHCFFALKILKSSNKNWFITAPIVILALLRLLAASVSTVEMVRLHQYSAFTKRYPGWVFTTGLCLSAGTDVIITGWLCYFLREMRSRMGSTLMIQLVDTLTLYTIETGALTSVATIASLISWLTMPTNLIFLGLHFVIGKLYANSLLASLNTRKELRRLRTTRQRPWVHNAVPILSTTDFPRQRSTFSESDPVVPDPVEVYMSPTKLQKLEVNVQQTVQREVAGNVRRLDELSVSDPDILNA